MLDLPKIPPKKEKYVVQRAWGEESRHSPYVARLKYEDRHFKFEMHLTPEEADIYQNALTTYERVKSSEPDPDIRRHWKEQRFICLHDHFGERIRRYSSLAKYIPRERQRAIEYCELQIQFAPLAKRAFENDPFTDELPDHIGYRYLIGFKEEERAYGEALYLARLAGEEGWRGNWGYLEHQIRKAMEEKDPEGEG